MATSPRPIRYQSLVFTFAIALICWLGASELITSYVVPGPPRTLIDRPPLTTYASPTASISGGAPTTPGCAAICIDVGGRGGAGLLVTVPLAPVWGLVQTCVWPVLIACSRALVARRK